MIQYYKRKNNEGYYYKVDNTGGLEIRTIVDFERICSLTEDSVDHIMEEVKYEKLIAIDSEDFYQQYNKVREVINKLVEKLN